MRLNSTQIHATRAHIHMHTPPGTQTHTHRNRYAHGLEHWTSIKYIETRAQWNRLKNTSSTDRTDGRSFIFSSFVHFIISYYIIFGVCNMNTLSLELYFVFYFFSFVVDLEFERANMVDGRVACVWVLNRWFCLCVCVFDSHHFRRSFPLIVYSNTNAINKYSHRRLFFFFFRMFAPSLFFLFVPFVGHLNISNV